MLYKSRQGRESECLCLQRIKSGCNRLYQIPWKELAGFNIAVNYIAPDADRTPIFDQSTQAHIDYMLSKIPRNRFLEVEESAAMIA